MQYNKKIKFYTLGCKVNQYETQGLREQFLKAGFREYKSNFADVYIINTCTVTARADKESRRLIKEVLRFNPKSRIIVTGCYAEEAPDEILEISKRIKIIPNSQKRLLKISDFKGYQRAFVKVQDGCDNFCSYCKVPLVRGRSRSRRPKEIIVEIGHLINRGFKEVVLCGICLGSYKYRGFNLVTLLAALENIDGEFRLRLSSIEPQLVGDELIEKIADSEKVCPHFHIPLQSADDAILKKMNRRYLIKDYLSLIAKIRKKVKDAAITTDVLVGFPGEKEKNFRNTVRYLKEISPLRTHIFSFSPRQGTAAFEFRPRIETKLIKERANLLKKVAAQCSYKFRRRFLGKRLSVLIESQAGKLTAGLCGYSENYIRVNVENASQKDINNLVRVKVNDVDVHVTKGRLYLAK